MSYCDPISIPPKPKNESPHLVIYARLCSIFCQTIFPCLDDFRGCRWVEEVDAGHTADQKNQHTALLV